ncbi:hypothetical protein CY652_22855 [Burkholderia sp. WAC0059]|nr:hypothetical protein CY652_22855 [Burkholderia sp. WAC0059]
MHLQQTIDRVAAGDPAMRFVLDTPFQAWKTDGTVSLDANSLYMASMHLVAVLRFTMTLVTARELLDQLQPLEFGKPGAEAMPSVLGPVRIEPQIPPSLPVTFIPPGQQPSASTSTGGTSRTVDRRAVNEDFGTRVLAQLPLLEFVIFAMEKLRVANNSVQFDTREFQCAGCRIGGVLRLAFTPDAASGLREYLRHAGIGGQGSTAPGPNP